VIFSSPSKVYESEHLTGGRNHICLHPYLVARNLIELSNAKHKILSHQLAFTASRLLSQWTHQPKHHLLLADLHGETTFTIFSRCQISTAVKQPTLFATFLIYELTRNGAFVVTGIRIAIEFSSLRLVKRLRDEPFL
jgi:hypothetical protein